MATSAINTPAKRKRLQTSGEPHWDKLGKGRFIGYRKGKAGGSWVARLGPKRDTIGTDSKLDYEQALKKVIAWVEREEVGGNSTYLLTECIADYITSLEVNKSERTAKDTKARLNKHLDDKLLDTEVRKLTTKMLNKWRDAMVAGAAAGGDPETIRKRKNGANRTLNMLKAALNKAFKDGVVDSDREWRRVSRFADVNTARLLFLTDEQIDRLLEVAQGAFHQLVSAAVLTGARYGELTSAKVSDFDRIKGLVHLSGKTGARDCYLSSDGMQLFKGLAQGKLPEAPLLMSPAGGHWLKGEQTKPMQSAVRAAKLPRDTVFYSLRHYHISKAVHAGISMLAVAKNCGTSVKMIETHYGKFAPADMSRLMDLVEIGSRK